MNYPNAKTTQEPTSVGQGSSELRKHYFLNRYVIVAPKRNLRPESFKSAGADHKTETASSPAIENDPSLLELGGKGGHWLVKVVDNAFPALSPDNPKSYGKQEVIIETPDHNVEFSELPVEHIETIFEAYASRTQALYRLDNVKYVCVFKNDGPAAGASIAHAHSQIVALPVTPPDIKAESDALTLYKKQYNTCAYCYVLTWERDMKERLIYEDNQIVVIAPYASTSPFDAWLIPKRHAARFQDLTVAERHSFAVALKQLTSRLDLVKISFNFFLADSLPEAPHHFVLKLEPRISIWAGFELATGIIVNQVAPEYAAAWYRGEIS